MIEFAFHVGVVQILVAFAAAPEHIVLATKSMRDFQRLFDLSTGIGKHIGVATGCRAVHESRIAEHVGRAPQQLDTAPLLFLFQDIGDRVQVAVRFRQRAAFGRDVAIMKRVVGCLQFLKQLKGCTGAILSIFDRLAAVIPRTHRGSHAERIRTGAAEGVPVDDGESKMILHRFAFHRLVRVVPAKCERIVAIGAFVRYGWDVGESAHAAVASRMVGWSKPTISRPTGPQASGGTATLFDPAGYR